MDSKPEKKIIIKRKRVHVVDHTKKFKGGHSIMELPNDCLRTICSFLSKFGLSRMSMTSKGFHSLIFGSIENTYNRHSIHLFHNRGMYELLL